ncbi:hypothetical protein BTHE68_17210 [Burkholderia sp. THE68]|uniref:hypothetical protein n=1 Tax=Burkholderia sp. THE68 TaxID=758782 RepID=UPI001318F21B|nr:hypothetical protein [Burkholderia sp. THE68]BBU27987.1 hypothetical protein BTHE68_17210 [Burkholderia sp. THE68]
MGKRKVLTVTGAVSIDHRIGQIAASIKRAQETVTHQRQSLCDEQAMRLERVDAALSLALASAKLSMEFFKEARPSLRPMDATEQHVIEELVDSGVAPKTHQQLQGS